MPKRPTRVVSIGAGNVAHHLIPALKENGMEIVQVFSRDISNAEALSKKTQAQAIDQLKNIDPKADWYLILVPDDAIATVVKDLKKIVVLKRQLITHSSGATDSKVFKSLTCKYGVFYALQSFKQNNKVDLKSLPFIIHGSDTSTTKKLVKTAKLISNKVIKGDDTARLKYHLTAVFVNNFVNHIHCKANSYMEAESLDKEILAPIIASTFKKLSKLDACEIQTGPARRGDEKTMKKHLKLLTFDKELADIYREVSDSIQKHYKTES